MKISAFLLLFTISYISFAGARPEELDQVKDLASCLDKEFESDYEAKHYDKRMRLFMEKCKQQKKNELG